MGKTITITESQLKYVVDKIISEDETDDVINLIQNVKIGDTKSFTKLYDYLYPVLIKKTYSLNDRYSDDDINQIINNTILKVFKGINQYSGPAPFGSWVLTIFKRTIADYIKKEKNYKDSVKFPEIVREPAQENSRNELGKELLAKYKIFKKFLSEKQKKYFDLYLNGYSHIEIGNMLGSSEGTSKWHVSTVLSKFKRWLVNNKDI